MTLKQYYAIIFSLMLLIVLSIVFIHPGASAKSVPEFHPIDPLRQTQLLQVAGVLGQFPECRERFPRIVYAVTDAARAHELQPQLLAAVVAVESRCDPLSVSWKGAIGITQVMPHVWGDQFDFQNKYNLFNTDDNLAVGAAILRVSIKKYGVRDGLEHYQGTGSGRDGGYVDRILKLAGPQLAR